MPVLLILTPLLLLAIVSLLGFVGCTTFTGTDSGEGFVITTTSPLPDATVNGHYATAMAASGGVTPFHWTITGGALPAGLTMDDAGNISGIATGATGQYSVTIQVADSTTSSDPSKTPMPQTAQGSLSEPDRLHNRAHDSCHQPSLWSCRRGDGDNGWRFQLCCWS